ncbi:Cyclic nucleotide-gated ion channel protein [Thalictrum thalictroides]|uniref:Cyclic nucleotide-gated ion channel protein n=1 Tax=Thalictrum thalictroides TaxID=46969 RepID=A0A7J6WRR8_THATH|nr:Cyclic nucleotide-gated ion channel protein [Thalictrum thalictroides]
MMILQVPLFDQMDERMLDAICERLQPALYTQGTCLVREGDPVNEMLFIIRGHLDSYTTNGPEEFCGEELLTWALDPRPNIILPSSTHTVEAINEVEAFVLTADDLKFVASQFRRLPSKQLRHKFQFYSHQWRTWAACFVQAAWWRYKKRKNVAELKIKESRIKHSPGPTLKNVKFYGTQQGSGLAVYVSRLAASTRTSPCKAYGSESNVVSSLQKPDEPDFLVE